ncbi:uncharacterized protein DS421_7g213030 [Arachis hypogaea]|nr:uncharacterized protein DS421_7g213030 [Arachis hypogaea]
MEENMQRFLFIAVTKGHKPSVYTSWEEVNQQVIDFTFPEFHDSIALNAHAHASKRGCRPFVLRKVVVVKLVESGRMEVAKRNWLSPAEAILTGQLFHVRLVKCIEEWLLKVCLEAEIPCPCFFKVKQFVGEQGPFFGFTVVIPGHPFEIELFVIGRFSMVEKAAREDAAYEMLCVLLDVTGKEIQDYNYRKVKLLSDSNNALRAGVGQLEESYEKLKASYDSLLLLFLVSFTLVIKVQSMVVLNIGKDIPSGKEDYAYFGFCVFMWTGLDCIFWLKLRDLSKNLIQRLKRTADAVGF